MERFMVVAAYTLAVLLVTLTILAVAEAIIKTWRKILNLSAEIKREQEKRRAESTMPPTDAYIPPHFR
jgi:hypothetical protein